MEQYPPKDSQRAEPARALVSEVLSGSPAEDAGFEAGCFLTAVDGEPLRDIVDWRWLAASDEIEVGYIDLDGEQGTARLWREAGQDWGFVFDGLVFDGVKQCRNSCTFCFMRQLPEGMRRSLYVRDDDFRLSFLVGTFVTLTNLSGEDEARIVEQRISPLRVSLQAFDGDARRKLIGKHAHEGIAALERLLAAGIEFHAQIVLVPGENDGAVLSETLGWAYRHPGILDVGIVPLGYTRHQTRFKQSFNDPEASCAVLAAIEPFQRRALFERGHAWVYAADEFYRNAYRDRLLEHVPESSHYGDYTLFEDGIGIIRATVDDWERAWAAGAVGDCARAASEAGVTVRLVAGFAQREFLDALIKRSGISRWFKPLYIRNDFFGGNVDVTGLLTAQDIVAGVASSRKTGQGPDKRPDRLFVPRVIFNDDGLTLDDRTLEDMEKAAGSAIGMVSCSPREYFEEIATLLRHAEQEPPCHCPSSPS